MLKNTKFKRLLSLYPLIQESGSLFLFGPRLTGKTYLIEQELGNRHGTKIFNLLDTDTHDRLLRRPKRLTEEITENEDLIVIDEIQKLPILLNLVHLLIEERNLSFLLTGSSARKLKREDANLLGGRAGQASLFPLIYPEIPNFNLVEHLNFGGLPRIKLSKNPTMALKNYVQLYLREEVQMEALVRKLNAFVRFLDVMALQNGEELNYQGISNDAGVPVRTIENYIQILKDTLLGFELFPFLKTKKRKAITRSKFFFFDLGVLNALAKRGFIEEKTELFGRAFEHFLVLEVLSFLHYKQMENTLCYWRSTSGFEVDLIFNDRLAIEIKGKEFVSDRDLKGLKALKEEGLIKTFIVVSLESTKRRVDDILIYPWKIFLEELWKMQILGVAD